MSAKAQRAKTPVSAHKAASAPQETTPEVDALVREIISRIADKWTMLVLEVLGEHRELRFTMLGKLVGGVSQKMLTKTVRQMERDGLIIRTIHPVIPPRVEYKLTALGGSLAEAFCGVWVWALTHHDEVVGARRAFDARKIRKLGHEATSGA
jgi:DNA-binding HxlR family transcriptional regulator